MGLSLWSKQVTVVLPGRVCFPRDPWGNLSSKEQRNLSLRKRLELEAAWAHWGWASAAWMSLIVLREQSSQRQGNSVRNPDNYTTLQEYSITVSTLPQRNNFIPEVFFLFSFPAVWFWFYKYEIKNWQETRPPLRKWPVRAGCLLAFISQRSLDRTARVRGRGIMVAHCGQAFQSGTITGLEKLFFYIYTYSELYKIVSK